MSLFTDSISKITNIVLRMADDPGKAITDTWDLMWHFPIRTVTDWLYPMPPMPGMPDSIGNTIGEGYFVSRCYGTTKLGGNKIRFNAASDTDLRVVVAHCMGEVEGVSEWQVNDLEWSTLTGAHTKTEYKGTRVQTADARFSSRASAYRGIAYTVFTFVKNDQQIGYDPNITVIMSGLKCLPLAGGGAAVTRNPAVILYDWYLNVEGYSAGSLDLNAFKSLEALSDQVPTGSSLPRYRFDYNFDANMSVNDAKKLIWQSFNGRVIQSQGKLKPVWDSGQMANGSGGLTAKTVSHAFTEDNIVVDSLTWKQIERPNLVRIHYLDSSKKYKKTSVEEKDHRDIDLNGEIIYEEECWFITDSELARRRCKYKYNKFLYTDYTCELSAFSGASDLEGYDLVTVTHQLPGWTAKQFLVSQKSEDAYGRMKFTLEAYYAGIYDDAQVGTQVSYESNLPNPYSPPSASTSITATLISPGVGFDYDSVKVSFTPPAADPFYKETEIYASRDDATYYLAGTSKGESFVIQGMGMFYVPGDTCYVKLRNINEMGVKAAMPGAASASVAITGSIRLGSFYAGLYDFWGGNAAIGNAATTIVLGNLDGTPKLALGPSADSLTLANVDTLVGFYADGTGSFRHGGPTAYGKFDAGAGTYEFHGVTISSDSEVDVSGTTANTWTVNSDLTNANIDLVLGRMTGGNATIRWDGSVISVDKITNFADKVGIGTTTPGEKLDVQDGKIHLTGFNVAHGMTDYAPTETALQIQMLSSSTGGAIIRAFSDADNYPLQIIGVFGTTNPSDSDPAINIVAAKKSGTGYQALSALESVFNIQNSGTDLVRVLGSGNVGIGATVPLSKLQITSDSSVTPFLSFDDSAVGGSRWQMGPGTGTGLPTGFGLFDGSAMSLYVKQGGNVGIGTTNMPTIYSGHVGVFISKGAALYSNTAVNCLRIENNVYYDDPTGNPLYISNGYGQELFVDATGGFEFFTAPLGNAAGAVTFTNRLTILNTGNVGSGTATPRKQIDSLSTSQSQLRLTYADDSVYSDFTVGSGGNLTVAPTGDFIFDPAGNDILPNTNYDLNVGSLSKKYLTLHAAELWVETLVAQETIATIGGRIVVAPTNILTTDLGSGDTTIYVKYNNMASGDRIYMEANGKVEFMAVTSAAGGGGPYSYSVTRNLDGTGANDWYAGDAILNTGTTGDGFIDIYSVRGIKESSDYGPTIVGNVRNSATYNDWTECWAIGNLNGLYGYGLDTYGAAFGKYSEANYLTIEATNGIRFFDTDDVVRAQLTSTTWTIGYTSTEHVAISTTSVQIKDGATVYTDLTSGILTLGAIDDKVVVDATGMTVTSGGVTRLTALDTGVIAYGDNATTYTSITASGLSIYDNSVLAGTFTSTAITLNGATTDDQVLINNTGMTVKSNNVTRLTALDTGVTLYGDNATTYASITASGVTLVDDNATVASFAATTTIGSTSTEHISISSTAVQIKDNTTVYAELTAGALTLGDSSNEHVLVNTSGVALKDNTSVYAQFAATTTIGLTTGEHVSISSTAVQIKDGATVYTDLSAGTLTLGNAATDKYLQFDGTYLILGRDSKFPGTDAYNNDAYYYHQYFESLDSYETTVEYGGVVAINGCLTLTTGAQSSARAEVYRDRNSVMSSLTFSSNSRFKAPITISWTDTTFAGYFVIGEWTSNNGYGFMIQGSSLYGLSLNTSDRSEVDLSVTLVSGTKYILEAVFTTGSKVQFYVNSVYKGQSTTYLPSGTDYANRIIHALLVSTDVDTYGVLLCGECIFIQE